MSPTKYIERFVENYVQMFGSKPKQNFPSSLDKSDHPEMDTSDELEIDDILKYQSLIAALKWVIAIGRFDIGTAIMTISSFRAAPRAGNLQQLKMIFGYLYKMLHAAILFLTDLPDYASVPPIHHKWEQSIYGNVNEVIPDNAPKHYGPTVRIPTYVDSNLCHDMI